MTPQEKGRATRAAHKAAQDARWKQGQQDKADIIKALRAILTATDATPAQKLTAALLLDDAQSYHLFSGRVLEAVDNFTADTTT